MAYDEREVVRDALIFTAPVGTPLPARWEFPKEPWVDEGDVELISIKRRMLDGESMLLDISGFETREPRAVFFAGWSTPRPNYKRAYYIWELRGTRLINHPEHAPKSYGSIIDRRV